MDIKFKGVALFEKNIQIIKFGKGAQFEMDFENML